MTGLPPPFHVARRSEAQRQAGRPVPLGHFACLIQSATAAKSGSSCDVNWRPPL